MSNRTGRPYFRGQAIDQPAVLLVCFEIWWRVVGVCQMIHGRYSTCVLCINTIDPNRAPSNCGRVQSPVSARL